MIPESTLSEYEDAASKAKGELHLARAVRTLVTEVRQHQNQSGSQVKPSVEQVKAAQDFLNWLELTHRSGTTFTAERAAALTTAESAAFAIITRFLS